MLHNSVVIAAKGLTPDHEQILKIYDKATVSQSRIVHQAQIYGEAMVNYAFVEHRAEVFDSAILEGNDLNNVWVCDCAKVYGTPASLPVLTTMPSLPSATALRWLKTRWWKEIVSLNTTS